MITILSERHKLESTNFWGSQIEYILTHLIKVEQKVKSPRCLNLAVFCAEVRDVGCLVMRGYQIVY